MFHRATKNETTSLLKKFITEIENLVDKKVKVIRCDNGTEFKNSVMNDFCALKGIRKEFSVARTPQQNSVGERRNRTLIEAARTMVLVVKPHNKTLYEMFRDRTPALSFMRPFGCHVTILNTLDHLGKFDGTSNVGFFVGYLLNSKAFRVYNLRTRKVEENLHIRFLEDKPSIAGNGPKWLFDIDVLTKSMNYVLVVTGTNSNDFVGTEESIGKGHSIKEKESSQDYILMPLWKDGLQFDSSSKNASNDESQPSSHARHKDDEGVSESEIDNQKKFENSTQDVNTGLEDPDHPDKVCKVVKALYGLHQAPRAWLMKDKFQMSSIRELTFFLGLQSASTPVDMKKTLIKDVDGDDVDVHLYRSMIGSLMYLTASRPDIIYLEGHPKLGLWYPKDSLFELVAYTDSDYVGVNLDRKSTTGGCQFLGSILISWQCKNTKLMLLGKLTNGIDVNDVEAKVKTVNGEERIQALVDKKKVIITETSVRSDLHIEDAKEDRVKFLMFPRFVQVFMDSQVEGMLKHEEIYVTPSNTKKIFANMNRQGKDFSDEHVTTTSNDLLSGKDRLKLNELMELCTQLQSRLLALETTKANQELKIGSLRRRLKKLEKKASKKTHKLKRLYKIGSSTRVESSKDAEVVAEKEVSTAEVVPTTNEVVTTAGVEAKGIVIQEPSETSTPTPIDSSQQPSKAKDKGKAKMTERREACKTKEIKKDNLALIKSYDNTQAMMDADYKLAVGLQEEEREELSIKEKSRLFVELMDKKGNIFQDLKLKDLK
nr:hypothetical protein [Tanacetum cinerariifolium]